MKPAAALALILSLLAAPGALAQEDSGRAAELQERMKQRRPHIVEARRGQHLGEDWRGYLSAVKPEKIDDQTRRLMDQENADRREVYRLVAEGQDKLTPAHVAQRSVYLELRKVHPEELFLDPEGQWRQRRDALRYGLILRLKMEPETKGEYVGETSDGLVELVQPERLEDDRRRQLQRLVRDENTYRRKVYAGLAKDHNDKTDDPEDHVTPEQVAQQAGARHFKAALPGAFLKYADGRWSIKK